MNRIPRIAVLLLLPGCASIPSATEVAALGTNALVGTWNSVLDNTRLTVAKDGSFRLDKGATQIASGHWRTEGTAVVFIDDPSSTGGCAGVEGSYAPEIVRDTVRFTKSSDDCPAREERMAWPWKRPESR